MEDDDYPNFGNAFPSTVASSIPTGQASWNPALRPDAEAVEDQSIRPQQSDPDDDFFDRYPGATPKKSEAPSKHDLEQKLDARDEEEDDEPLRRGSISVQQSVQISHQPAPKNEKDRRPSTQVEVEAPFSPHRDQDREETTSLDTEDPVFHQDTTLANQREELEEAMPELPTEIPPAVKDTQPNGVEEADYAAKSDDEDNRPEAHYEHQGDINEMDRAVDESAEAPLMEDEQPLPTASTVSRVGTLDVDDGTRPPPPLDRSFTTNFTDAPVQESQGGEGGPRQGEEWPAIGDDKTFAELLENPSQNAPEQETEIAERERKSDSTGSGAANQDLNAAWAAALDDDDILEDTSELDPTSFFGNDGDDDGFLEDEEPLPEIPSFPQAQRPQRPQQQQRSVSAYTPSSFQQQTHPSTFAAPASPFIDQSHGRSSGTPSTGLFDLYNSGGVSQQQPQQQQLPRPSLVTAQSYADKPKSGYQSPYDLPMDVVKPRRRPQPSPFPSQTAVPTPPPRTSSFGAAGAFAASRPAAPPSNASLSPPNSSHGPPMGPPTSTAPSALRSTPKSSPSLDGGFFADLPVAPRSRSRQSGLYTPQVSGMPTTPLIPQQQASSRAAPPPSAPAVQAQQHPAGPPTPAQQPPAIGGLRQPEKAPLFPDHPPTASTSQPGAVPPQTMTAPPQTQSRYSPAPPATVQVPAASSRYSPAPVGQPMKSTQRFTSAPAPTLPPTRVVQPFAPRTSSPLATHGRPQMHSESVPELARGMSTFTPGSPGKVNGIQGSVSLPPERADSSGSRYTPPGSSSSNQDSINGATIGSLSPNKQRAQSPIDARKPPYSSRLSVRPESAGNLAGMATLSTATGTLSAVQNPRLAHRRQFSRDLSFAVPQDERAHDPLERWKGHPIFHWNAAGTIVSSFPKQTPFYASGQGIPSLKCTPGDVRVVEATAVLPLSEQDAKFPGPLTARSKGRKKEVVAWISGKIENLQHETESVKLNFDISEEERKRSEEKLILWKTMRIFLEHDGVLEGSSKIEEEIRQLLMPDLAQMSQVMDLQSPVSASVTNDPVDKTIISQIRQALFEGQRERAVWLAEEKRLWGHAMLIASTISPDTFKQIVASFVRSQVKGYGASEARSLAALYQVFAGNPDDCVDELVPPSARAGFQMINKVDGKGSGNPLEGLDKWRETVSLVHSNPTPGNNASLLAVGKLLAGYGRIEAAHTCFLFSRTLAKHGGSDDAEAHFSLLGGNPATGDANLDSIMLTELFEYGTSLSAPATATQYVPHLQAYKLVHAQYLAASGLKGKAQHYCESIDSAIRATTRPSGYYHSNFAQELMSFNALLSQSPAGSGAGGKFFSRPAMDKVSSGVGSWFTKFVSGDEGETDSNASAQGASEGEAFGPFGGVASSSGPISRSESTTDLYNPVTAGGLAPVPSFQPPTASNRYGPSGAVAANRYAPSAAPFSTSRSSMESDRSIEPSLMPSAEPIRTASSRYAPAQGQSPSMLGVPFGAGSRRSSSHSVLSSGSYEPKPALAEHDGFGYRAPSYGSEAANGPVVGEEIGEAAPNGSSDSHSPVQTFDPETGGGYEPPSTSYEPPSYQPYQPEAEEEEVAEQKPLPKKKSFMDDDDDDGFIARAAALKKGPQRQNSRDPDPAIVAAAQADAARDAKGDDKKGANAGWFGGWFGKKDPNAAPGPIKAKLGEQSSFYFDKDLNKWVNKKAGAESATPAAPTPPPPRGPPSGSGGPGSAPPSRAGSLPGPPHSGPPSRVGTPASSAGPPGPAGPLQKFMPTPAINGEPSSRPTSSMSAASSLDDLLAGPPTGKKGGTVKGKKKGGRYVDVMSNAK